jgi:transcription termination/antitermination protein NusG
MDNLDINISSEDNTTPESSAPAKETKWYVLRVVNGKERKVKEYLDVEVRRNKWNTIINQILCPMEKVFKMQNGKKAMREKILYPGYILLEVNNKIPGEVVATLANVTNVIHFLGRENPTALRKSEVNKMFGKMDEVADSGTNYTEPFLQGETIKIIDGPFNDFNATIEEVNEEKKKIKAVVKIFGRSQPVELSFMQIEKIS